MTNKEKFDLICGTDPGDINAITETDIRTIAGYWNKQSEGDPVAENDIQQVIAGLEEYKEEHN